MVVIATSIVCSAGFFWIKFRQVFDSYLTDHNSLSSSFLWPFVRLYVYSFFFVVICTVTSTFCVWYISIHHCCSLQRLLFFLFFFYVVIVVRSILLLLYLCLVNLNIADTLSVLRREKKRNERKNSAWIDPIKIAQHLFVTLYMCTVERVII